MVGQARVADESVRLLGRYVLHGEIAVGGMATIHFGQLHGDSGFSRTVAIKRLHKQYARDPEFVSMFLDEARLAARIRHPNVVPTLDVVSTEGELFVVMEYVHGESLSLLIKGEVARGRRIPPTIVGAILSATLQGLHAAHEARDERGQPLAIVHRDVSPHNVLVGCDGVARVLDFGIAKAAGQVHTTRKGEIKGKLPYMAPEQLLGEATTRQVDIYSASVCLWEALTGRRLFSGKSEGDVLQQVLLGDVPSPSRFAPEIAKEVDDLVLRGLSREPSDRFPTAREMAIALEHAIGRPASPTQIADWMERVAGTALAERHRRVQEIEQQSTQPNSAQLLRELAPAQGAAHEEELAPSSTNVTTNSDAPKLAELAESAEAADPFDLSQAWRAATARKNRVKKVVLALAVLLVSALILAFVASPQAASPRAVAAEGTPPPGAPSAEMSASATAASPKETPPTEAPEATASAAAIKEAKPGRSAAPRASSVPPLLAPPPAAAARRGCDPNYFIDSTGRKRFKRECF